MRNSRPAASGLDYAIAALLTAAGGTAYISTLAPTLLDGDAALFQYTPYVLGVPYPTGYPTYVLLGHVWESLIPIGSIAYRMNLFSAVCGALALGLLYLALSRILFSRWGAAAAVLMFGTLPTYWRWATEAKIYTLHILLLSGILFCFSRLSIESNPSSKSVTRPGVFVAAGLLFGLALGNHSTTLLLAPGLVLLFWLEWRRLGSPVPGGLILRLTAPAIALPLLSYLYVPLRAGHLLAAESTLPGLTMPVAISRGLVSEYFRPGLNGLIRYFTASDFTGGVVTNWGSVPANLVDVYWPLVRDDFTLLGVFLALLGAGCLAQRRPRRFWPLFLMYVALVPFVLTYGQGEQSAFLLPSSLMLCIFGGAAVGTGIDFVLEPSGIPPRQRLAVLPVALALATSAVWLPWNHTQQNLTWLSQKWNDATYQYWMDALAHPMEEGSGVLAHWGDLTSFWYLQHTQNVRPDLYGLYPPSQEVVAPWLAAGRSLYVAGPLQGWDSRLQTDYQVVPWGRLVRLAPGDEDPLSLLPDLPPGPEGATFDGRVSLLMVDFPDHVQSGGELPVNLAWQTSQALKDNTRISLRLVAADGTHIAQSDDTLLSGWLPAPTLPPDQVFLTFHPFKLPAGTLPGTFRLKVVLFHPDVGEWRLPSGDFALDLGQVEVTLADPGSPVDPWGEYKPLSNLNFGGQIRLAGYDYSVTRAGQGKGFAAHFLWQATRPIDEDYTLLVELVNKDGRVLRDWRHQPAAGSAPTSTWQGGQAVRDQVDLILPADAPPGDNSVWVQLSWLTTDGNRLPVRRWGFPLGQSARLPGVRVVEKEDRVFEPPPIQQPLDVNFGDKIRLIGYNLPRTSLGAGDTLSFDVVWQSKTSDMAASYTVFLHLVDPEGDILAQGDKVPGRRSKQPTTGWIMDEIVVDPLTIVIPPGTPPGSYEIQMGLYVAPDGARLPLLDKSGMITGDTLSLMHVEVDGQ